MFRIGCVTFQIPAVICHHFYVPSSSIVFFYWWNHTTWLSLTSPRFFVNWSGWLYRKCTFILMLIPEIPKFWSLINCWIWGPSNVPAFNFSLFTLGKLLQIYWKKSSSLFSALTNYFISPNFIWRGRYTILLRGTKIAQ